MPNKRLHVERPDELVRLHVAEPAPLGLFGLAIGCLLLMCVDFGFTHGQLMLIPWIFLLPAGLQLIAGIIDFLRHNVFGGTAFIGYSVFWFGLSSVYFLEIEYKYHQDAQDILPSDPIIRQHTMIVCIGYLIFSIILSVVSLGINRILLSILLSIDFAFLVLILHSFMHDKIPAYIVGVALFFVFVTSFYGFIAILLLKVAGGEVLPIGRPLIKWVDYVITDPGRSRLMERVKINKKKVNVNKNKNKNRYKQIPMETNEENGFEETLAIEMETNESSI
eukprot:841346_1